MMVYTIDITIDHPLDATIPPTLLEALARAALAHQQAPDGIVSLVITDDDTVQDLNREYRGVDQPTDVLSFGLGGLAKQAGGPEEEISFIVPDGLPLEIGEVIISYPYAARTAAASGRPPRDEVALLTVHGVLHLLGHDHLDDDEGKSMRTAEAEILAGFGIERFEPSD